MDFPSKILLFGEYSVIVDGSAFAVPYFKYKGKISFEKSKEQESSNEALLRMLKSYENDNVHFHFLDIVKFRADLERGLWFDSNIPLGAGLGSSAALVAAIYHRYRLSEASSILKLKEELSRMESFFHGKSSGIDPLVSFIQKPISIGPNNEIEIVSEFSFSKLNLNTFIIDTKLRSTTSHLVHWFKEQVSKISFLKRFKEGFVMPTNLIVDQVKDNNTIDLKLVKAITSFQLNQMHPIIPISTLPLFTESANRKDLSFKICGSGGGGFILCFAEDRLSAISYFSQKGIEYQQID